MQPTQSTARFLGRILMAITTLATAAALTGCGGAMVRDDWEEKPSLPALPEAFLEVPSAELARHCGTYSNGTLHGCAKRDYKHRVCTIVTAPQPAMWLVAHERKHCAGFDHGPVDGAGIRTAAFESHAGHGH